LAGFYVDFLLCGFIAWMVCFTFGWQAYWLSFMLPLWLGEWMLCRDRLTPTAGEYCVGIRYLTSSSSQVVADIKVVHQKLKLNGLLIGAGVLELTLAIFLFSGWTFFGKAAFFGITFAPPLSVVHWALSGFAFFLCSGYLLSSSKLALWVVPTVHGFFLADFFLSEEAWREILKNDLLESSPAILHWLGAQPVTPFSFFMALTVFTLVSLVFSHKHLVN
jgi:hypothetical protein